MSDLHISHARLHSGELVDVDIREGVVSSVHPSGSGMAGKGDISRLDLNGRLLLPSLVEPHAHLDKAFLADRIPNETGDLMGAIIGLQQMRHSIDEEDIINRATAAVRMLSRNGTTTIRTHADTTLDNGLESVLALCAVRDACRDFMDIQVAALMEWPLTGLAGASRRSLAMDALDAGADVIGGCPHLDEDPAAAIEFLLETAIGRGVPLDLHADENLRVSSRDLETVAQMMISANVRHRVAASHCVSLSIMDERDAERTADAAAEAGVSVIALPQTNLFLQGREESTRQPRGIAPVNMLHRHGVVTAAGGDNLQDPFNPMGRGDPLETAALMVMASHVPVEGAYEMVSVGARRAIGLEEVVVREGSRANFMALASTTLRESIATAPHDRLVIYGGKVLDDHTRNKK